MSQIFDYIPKLEKVSSVKIIPKRIWVEIVSFFKLFLYLVSFFESELKVPKKELASIKTEIDEEQVAQCKEVFENSIKRRELLENKADKILGIIIILVPIISTSLAYIFKENPLSTSEKLFVFIALGGAFLSIFLVLLASFRARKIKKVEEPFVTTVIDETKDRVHEYSKRRHGFLYLHCALNNQIWNDHIANFIKAAEYLIIVMFCFLLLAIGPIIVTEVKKQSKVKAPATTVVEQLKSINSNLIHIDSSLTKLSQVEKPDFSKELNGTLLRIQTILSEQIEINKQLQFHSQEYDMNSKNEKESINNSTKLKPTE